MAKQQPKQLAPNVTTDKTSQPQSLVQLTEAELNAIVGGCCAGDILRAVT